MKLSGNVKFFLELQSQIKILHWQTKSHAKHLALGDAYEALDEIIDKFVESCMGLHGRFILGDEEKNITINNLTDVDLSGMLKTVTETIQGFEINPKDGGLISLRDEMLVEVNKLSYLLTLR
jgi:hypothetical protein